jgi:acetylornithine deacetylase/succinyl-diaminopimelate desuccinylase-like protein
VVEAKPEDWTLPPFKLTEKDGYFYGRGTSDMKDNDAAVAESLIRLKKEGYVPDRDIIAAFTADEEVGPEANGVNFLLREHRDLIDAAMAVNPDVNCGALENGRRRDFSVETSEKTYATYTLEVTNKGGHSSEPRPDNAIYELAAGLVRLGQYKFPVVLNATTREYFASRAALETGEKRADMLAVSGEKPDPAAAERLSADVEDNALLRTTCVATMLSGGDAENALPQRAGATVQCRLMPGDTKAGVMKTLADVLADPAIRIGIIEPVLEAPESPPTRELMASVEKVVHGMWPGVPVFPVMAAGGSDSVFTRNAGILSYGISGVWIDVADDRAHGRDERELVGSFYENVEFTCRLMKELTGAR